VGVACDVGPRLGDAAGDASVSVVGATDATVVPGGGVAPGAGGSDRDEQDAPAASNVSAPAAAMCRTLTFILERSLRRGSGSQARKMQKGCHA